MSTTASPGTTDHVQYMAQYDDCVAMTMSVSYLPVLVEEDSSEMTTSTTSSASSLDFEHSPQPTVILRITETPDLIDQASRSKLWLPSIFFLTLK